ANMTISGANADKRVALKPSELKQVVLALAGKGGSGLKGKAAEAVQKAKAALQRAGGKGVVITGLPDIEAQQAVLSINAGSEVMDTDNAIMTRQGSAAQVN